MREDAKRLDEPAPLLASASDREAEHRAATARQELACQRAVRMLRQLRIADRLDEAVAGEEFDDPARVLDMALHAKRQRLDTLQGLEGRHRRHAGTEVAD